MTFLSEVTTGICPYCGDTFTPRSHDNRRVYCSTQCSDDVQRRRSNKSVERAQLRQDSKWRAVWLNKLWTRGNYPCKQI